MKFNRLQKLEKIIHLNALMNQTYNLSDLLNLILVETERMFGVEGTSILLEDNHSGNLKFYVSTGEKKNILQTISMKRGEGVCGYVFESGKILMENDTQTSRLFSDKADKKSNFITQNLLCIPLQIKEKCIGVIELVNKKKGEFTQDDIEFLQAIANQISLSLERQILIDEKIKSEKMATIGETVAGLSHYIKNILNGFTGGAFIIDKNIREIESEKIKIGWDMIKNNIDKISQLVLDMLQYSKERKPELKPENVNRIIEEVIVLENERMKKRSIEIRKNLSADLPKILLETKSIFRCFLNLISNSIDALENSEKGVITITSKKDKSHLIIEIKDNGCGISVENQKKLFTKFFSTKGAKGTGFGLPITKKIIEEHHGSFSVSSQINKGTKFSIKLPITKL